MRAAGFVKVESGVKAHSDQLVSRWLPGGGVERYLASADIAAFKP
jgi:hypothetical protein